MNAVLTIPDARPASSGATLLVAASSSGARAVPAPMPSRIPAGRTSVRKWPPTGARPISARPAAASSSPATSGGLTPSRATSLAARLADSPAMIRFIGRNARPVSSGL
jgi:hypothetical protein